MKWWPLLMATWMALAACRGRDADLQRRRWALERQSLAESLERLEERMVVDAARVRFWREMRDRHQSVTAVACSSLGRHAEGMALFEERERGKRDARARRHRVAQLRTNDDTAVR